jgi:hypothetical protein
MKIFVQLGMLLMGLFLLSSCERTLDIKLAEGEKKLVVEASIYEDEYPFVLLTRSVGFSNIFDISQAQFEIGAQVKVTDNTTSETITLREYVIDTFVNGSPFKFSFHSIDFLQPNQLNFIGKRFHNYTMEITDAKGVVHTATTYMPNGNSADSIWANKLNPTKDEPDTTYEAFVMWKDPDTLGNYTRFTTRVLRKDKSKNLNEEWLSSFSSVFDDVFNNGKRLPFDVDLGYTKGVNFQDSASLRSFEKERSLYKGDTLIIRYSAIDYNIFQYWVTLEFSRNSTGNPFAAPTKVTSNFKRAIGAFGAYAASYDTLIIK